MKNLNPVKLILIVIVFVGLMSQSIIASFATQGNSHWDKYHKNERDEDKYSCNDDSHEEVPEEEEPVEEEPAEDPVQEDPVDEPAEEEPTDEEPEQEEPIEEEPIEEVEEDTPIVPKKNADLKIDKKVYNPSSKNYESNISKNGGSHPYIFASSDTVKFEIRISNIGEVEIKDIKVKDYMPSDLDYDDGDGDEKDDNKVEFGSFSLKPGEEKEFSFSADIERDRTDTGIVCTTNVVKVSGKRVDTDQSENSDDKSSFCYEVEQAQGGMVLGKESPESMPITGVPLIPAVLQVTGGIGMALIGVGIKSLAKAQNL